MEFESFGQLGGRLAFYFAVGAIFSLSAALVALFALVAALAAPTRGVIRSIATPFIFIFAIASALILGAYIREAAVALTSSNPYERWLFLHSNLLPTAQYSLDYRLHIEKVLVPQLFWLKRIRSSLLLCFLIPLLSLLMPYIERIAA